MGLGQGLSGWPRAGTTQAEPSIHQVIRIGGDTFRCHYLDAKPVIGEQAYRGNPACLLEEPAAIDLVFAVTFALVFVHGLFGSWCCPTYEPLLVNDC